MRLFQLCALCAKRFPKSRHIIAAKRAEGCFICRGLLSAIGALSRQAVELSDGFEWGSFSVASSFPKDALAREQDVCDLFSPRECTSMKNSANALAATAIKNLSGKPNSQREADANFLLDFSIQKAFFQPSPIFVFGRYLKLSRSHCQSRWQCFKCGGRGGECCSGSGKSYPSVEEELGKVFAQAFCAKDAKLHASGREDVDVRNLAGRAFVMELASPKKRKADLLAIEKQFGESCAVRAFGLRMAKKWAVEAVCNSHFDKEYVAIVSADRELSQQDCQKMSFLEGAEIEQQTPLRVLGRRADLVRKRKVLSISCQPEGKKLKLRILAEAGTYIKELVSSDGGRTKPSVASILGCNAVCEELDVAGIRDYFLETIEFD
ncbi:MAG: tRNA pseudouridine(54/55) synthase Pus10 [Candidatus Micrarchaeota archaeon]|nr:tRNA pseudouridine(54/55) synthase Pus10 [Candidatus Micrarchaeota archaeon]